MSTKNRLQSKIKQRNEDVARFLCYKNVILLLLLRKEDLLTFVNHLLLFGCQIDGYVLCSSIGVKTGHKQYFVLSAVG